MCCDFGADEFFQRVIAAIDEIAHEEMNKAIESKEDVPFKTIIAGEIERVDGISKASKDELIGILSMKPTGYAAAAYYALAYLATTFI